MTVCTKCLIDKADSEFGVDRTKKNGLRAHCKVCRSVEKKLYREANKEKISESAKAYHQANKEKRSAAGRIQRARRKDEIQIRHKNYREANREKILSYNLDYRQRNKDKISESGKVYYETNKEKCAIANRRCQLARPEIGRAASSSRRARKLRAIPSWEIDIRRTEVAWREANPGVELDHVVPLTPPVAVTLGGRPISRNNRTFIGPLIPLVYGFHTPANWQPLGMTENRRKGNRDWPNSPWS
jgi:hypothetical protein